MGGGGRETFCCRPIRIEIHFFVLDQSGLRSIPKTHNPLPSTSSHTPESHSVTRSQIIDQDVLKLTRLAGTFLCFQIYSATYDIVIYDEGCQGGVVGTEWNGDGWILLGSGLKMDCSQSPPQFSLKDR